MILSFIAKCCKSNSLFSLFTLSIVGAVALVILGWQSHIILFESLWDRNSVNSVLASDLHTQIPVNAINTAYSGWQTGPELDVDFDVSPESAKDFMSAICNGKFYSGYDPFHAVDIGEPFTYAHKIDMGTDEVVPNIYVQYIYYSYSPGIRLDIIGNRCLTRSGSGEPVQIRVDETNQHLYNVKLQLIFGCNLCKYVRINNMIEPVPDLPVYVLGMNATENIYHLTSSEACIGTFFDLTSRTDIVGPFNQSLYKTGYLFGANLRILLNNQFVEMVEFSPLGNDELINRQDAKGQAISAELSGNQRAFCFKVNPEFGANRMTWIMTTCAGIHSSYTWTFYSDDLNLPLDNQAQAKG